LLQGKGRVQKNVGVPSFLWASRQAKPPGLAGSRAPPPCWGHRAACAAFSPAPPCGKTGELQEKPALSRPLQAAHSRSWVPGHCRPSRGPTASSSQQDTLEALLGSSPHDLMGLNNRTVLLKESFFPAYKRSCYNVQFCVTFKLTWCFTDTLSGCPKSQSPM
jgi:hypothetical protein